MALSNNDFLNKLQIVRIKLTDQFLGDPGVSLIDIGLDPESKKDSGQIGVRVHLRHPSTRDELEIPSEIDGIPIYLVFADYELE